jgi:hypothetical protein
MDPTHHEKIVDKLLQYRGKIPKHGHLGNKQAQIDCYTMRTTIDSLINNIEWFAKLIEAGLIE